MQSVGFSEATSNKPRLEHLASTTRTAALGSFFPIIFIGYLSFAESPSALILAWAAYGFFVALARLHLSRALTAVLTETADASLNVSEWQLRSEIWVVAAALGWTWAGLHFFPASMSYETPMAMGFAAVATIATQTLAPMRSSVSVFFILSLLLPIASHWLLSGQEVQMVAGGMAAIYMAVLTRLAAGAHEALSNTLNISEANARLAHELSYSREAAETVNVALRRENHERAAAESRLKDFTEVAADWLWETDSELRFSYFSRRGSESSGEALENYIGKSRREITAESELDAKWRSHLNTLEERRPFQDFCYSRRLGDGQIRHVATSGRPIFSERGIFEGYRGVARDITEATEANLALAAAKERAEAADHLKSQFLANMSHELRTPMNGVLGMLDQALLTPLDDRQSLYVTTARDSAHSLLSILNDILDLSKLEAGQVQLEEVPMSPRQVTDDLVALLAGQAEEKGIYLGSDVHSEVPEWLEGDPIRLRQILLNLVGNAIKFTHHGGVKVGVSYQPSACVEAVGTIRFEVRDTGIGLSPEAQSRVFDRFVQADASTTREYGGTGLGLAICRQLIELNRGVIELESELGSGSAFWFTLPTRISLPPESSYRCGETNVAPLASKLKILAAEDNLVNQKVIRACLEAEGHEVAVVDDGEEAVAAVKRERFDLVLMDAEMPIMDGPSATRAIRELASDKAQIAIIALTANAMAGDREKYIRLGMDDYVSKPVEIEALKAAMARAIGVANQRAAQATSVEPPGHSNQASTTQVA